MELYINDELINYSIEQESNLHDIIQSIYNQLGEEGVHILSISLNGEHLVEDSQNMKHIPVSEINTLHIEAELKADANITLINTILQYLQIVQNSSEKGQSSEGIDEVDIQHILNAIDKLGASYQDEDHAPLKHLLDYYLNMTGAFSHDKNIFTTKTSDLILNHILTALKIRLLLCQDNDKNWIEITKFIGTQMDFYSEVAELFMNNQEEIGIQCITTTNDMLLEWMTCLSHPPEQIINTDKESDWNTLSQDLNEEIRPFFEEQGEAISVSDWVTVSDLIEYEIAPKISEYTQKILSYAN